MNISSRVQKTAASIVIGIIFIAIVLVIIYIKMLFPSPISKHDMEVEFLNNIDILTNVANHLENQQYDNIYITSTDKKGEMFASNSYEVGHRVSISDATISENIAALFRTYNYSVITKEGNGIYFQRWANRDSGRGVVYSINGEQPENDYVTKIEPLTAENWYFYEEE